MASLFVVVEASVAVSIEVELARGSLEGLEEASSVELAP